MIFDEGRALILHSVCHKMCYVYYLLLLLFHSGVSDAELYSSVSYGLRRLKYCHKDWRSVGMPRHLQNLTYLAKSQIFIKECVKSRFLIHIKIFFDNYIISYKCNFFSSIVIHRMSKNILKINISSCRSFIYL